MLLRTKLDWSPDEPGTHCAATTDDYDDPCGYSTHRHARNCISAWFNDHNDMSRGLRLGVFATQAQARAACQKHWDTHRQTITASTT
jgi:hypothetical protein